VEGCLDVAAVASTSEVHHLAVVVVVEEVRHLVGGLGRDTSGERRRILCQRILFDGSRGE
jgi:hypothetical protein